MSVTVDHRLVNLRIPETLRLDFSQAFVAVRAVNNTALFIVSFALFRIRNSD